MPEVDQPSGLNSAQGVILTVGIRTSGDRCAIVIPIVTDNVALDAKTLCQNAADSADSELIAILQPCLSEDAYISFVQTVGMVDGKIPARIDYGPTEFPGTGAATCETSQVAGLIGFYADPADLPAGSRMRFSKNFIPGIPDPDITGDTISSGLQTYLEALAEGLAEGFTAATAPTKKWYRVMATPSDHAAPHDCMRVGVYLARFYSGTQRRRLVPH